MTQVDEFWEFAHGRAWPATVQADFVAAAGDYGRRRSITYAAWREVGVPSSVLVQAGISRTG
jgi:hypothetical protein